MKKIMIILLAALMIISVTSCGKTERIADNNDMNEPANNNNVDEPADNNDEPQEIQYVFYSGGYTDGGTAAGGDKVVAHLKSLGVSTIDYVVATHPDADHIGGLLDVFEAFTVKNFVHSGKTHTSATFEKLLTAVINEGSTNIEPNTSDMIPLDSTIKIQVLHANKNANDNNDA